MIPCGVASCARAAVGEAILTGYGLDRSAYEMEHIERMPTPADVLRGLANGADR